LKKVLPGANLAPLRAAHPVFNSVFKLTAAAYTPAAAAARPGLTEPYLEGIALNGDVKVIYSPIDLETGWQGLNPPLARAYQSDDALKLGVNIIMYAMTHRLSHALTRLGTPLPAQRPHLHWPRPR
jgi:hypothetical protein